MPFKNLASLGVEERCITEWLAELAPRTALNYGNYFLRYKDWFMAHKHWSSAQAMLDEYEGIEEVKDRFRHVDVLKTYIRSKGTGSSDKRNTWYAVRSFYAVHRSPLPKIPRNETARLFKPSENDKRRSLELSPLKLDEVRRVILNAPQPYKAALTVMLQSAMGLAEFTQFNRDGWHGILDRLHETGPLLLNLYREKTSRTRVDKYYTFIGEDGKQQIRNWWAMRPDTDVDALFVVYNKNQKHWVPLRGRLIGDMITTVAKRIGLIQPNELQRYHIHAHEFRDLFKSLCTLNGVNPIASEFFLGHRIDKLGYDKSPQYDVAWFRREYTKVEPQLNLLSNPHGDLNDRMDKLKGEVVLEAVRSFAQAMGIDPMRVRIEKQRKLKREPTPEEEIQLLQAEVQQLRVTQPRNESTNGKPYQSKIVDEDELVPYVEGGWEIVRELGEQRFLMKKSNHIEK